MKPVHPPKNEGQAEHTEITENARKGLLNTVFSACPGIIGVFVRFFRVFRVQRFFITEILGEPINKKPPKVRGLLIIMSEILRIRFTLARV